MSVDCIYAVLVGLKSGKVISSIDLSNEIGYSTSAIESAVRSLKKHDIVKGVKGYGGGYRLVKSFDEITINDLFLCVKTKNNFQRKLLSRWDGALIKDL